jgi:phytoene dehydrogenase-like protein
MRYDVVIIGAGMSGLAAGVRLAHFGRRVLIVEQHALWGGLNSFYKKGGHHFDVGLHAVTNWMAPGYRGPRIPMQRILRQLRIGWEELGLEPQTRSSVWFDEARMVFTNDLAVLTEEVGRVFPDQLDGFVRLSARCATYPEANADTPRVSTRRVLTEYLSDPLLVDMLLCPLMFYGDAEEEDMDFEQFVILFNSIYREGFCRPRRGVRQVLDVLLAKYVELGGELRRRTPVERLVVKDGRVTELVLGRGENVEADVVLSSAGLVETMALRSDVVDDRFEALAGKLAFTETLWLLDADPRGLGFEDCVTFFNRGPGFRWRAPEAPVDLASGVICVPGNYAHAEPLDRHMVRATHLANPRVWFEWDEARYREEKGAYIQRSMAAVAERGGDLRGHVTYTDGFTPRTVTQYTRHRNGAVYGSPHKVKSGRTEVENLFLCGTDQGFVGIVGAMLSGIAMANQHGLRG